MRELLLSSRELQRYALRYGIILFLLKKPCPYTTFVVCAPHLLPSPLGDSPVRGNVRKDKRVCVSAEGKVGDVSRSDEVF